MELSNNPLTSLDPLATLPSLERLAISNTGQSDLAALTGLPLEFLAAADNGIVDVTSVTTFTPDEMSHLDLSNNAIVDLSPFVETAWFGAGCGVELRLEGNPVAASPTVEQDYPYVCELGMFVIWNWDAALYCGEPPCP